MRIFNLDLHISVIADIKYIINKLYPNDEISITNWSISGHNWVFNLPNENIEIINQSTWKNINKEMINKFCERYDDFLKTFDAFIVTHTPVFCLIFERYNKPIILINSCRYEQPYSWKNDLVNWNYLSHKLYHLFYKKLLIPVSNNLADKEYLKLGCNIDSIYIPSLCLYTNLTYKNLYRFLVYDLNNYIPRHNNFVNRYRIRKYDFDDMRKYRAIIHIPYEASTMSIFEQYNMNIPLFFPSKTLLKELIKTNKIQFNSRYAKNIFPESLTSTLGTNWIDFWIDHADYYNDNMPHITYFNNTVELFELLYNSNYDDITIKMAEFNKIKNEKVYNQWKSIINDIKTK